MASSTPLMQSAFGTRSSLVQHDGTCMAAPNESGAGDGCSSDRNDPLKVRPPDSTLPLLLFTVLLLLSVLLMSAQDTTFALAAAIHCCQTTKVEMVKYARRLGIDTELKNWFGVRGSSRKGGLYTTSGHGADGVYTLTAKGQMVIANALNADEVHGAQHPVPRRHARRV